MRGLDGSKAFQDIAISDFTLDRDRRGNDDNLQRNADTIISTANAGDGMYFSTEGTVTVDNYYHEDNESGGTGGDTRNLNINTRNNDSGPELDVPNQDDVGAFVE